MSSLSRPLIPSQLLPVCLHKRLGRLLEQAGSGGRLRHGLCVQDWAADRPCSRPHVEELREHFTVLHQEHLLGFAGLAADEDLW